MKLYLFSAKDQGRVHQFGTEVLPEIFMVYALNPERSWIGDLLIVSKEDLETMPPSEIPKKKFKSKEMDLQEKKTMNM